MFLEFFVIDDNKVKVSYKWKLNRYKHRLLDMISHGDPKYYPEGMWK